MNEKSGFFAFLIKKVGHYSFSHLIFTQIEAFLVWLFGSFSGIIGFILRNVMYRLLFKEIKGFAWIQPNVQFVETGKLKVGRFFGINSGSYINAIGGITIGDYVLIGSNVTISSGQHPIDGIDPPIFLRPVIPKEIIIEDDVWIGAGAVIMPGITLRKGTVVGACSVVTKSTEEYAVVVGAPAKKIRSRNDRVILSYNLANPVNPVNSVKKNGPTVSLTNAKSHVNS